MRRYGIWWRGVLCECIKRVAVHLLAAAQCPRAWRFFRYNRAASNQGEPAWKIFSIYGVIIGITITAAVYFSLPVLRPLDDDPLAAATFAVLPALSAVFAAYLLPLLEAYKNPRGFALATLLALDGALLLTPPLKREALFAGAAGDLLLSQLALAVALANGIITATIALPLAERPLSPAARVNTRLLVCGVALGALTAIPLMLFLPPLQGIVSASLYGKYLFLLIIPTFCTISNVVLNAQLKCRRDKAGLLYMGFYALGSAALCGLLTVKSIPALMNTPDMLRLAVMAVCYALTSGALAAWLSLPEESSE